MNLLFTFQLYECDTDSELGGDNCDYYHLDTPFCDFFLRHKHNCFKRHKHDFSKRLKRDKNTIYLNATNAT